jgi:gamma-glutamylcyclotransferase (GGCT)/AIG2-like uncharacterized protein YtfP
MKKIAVYGSLKKGFYNYRKDMGEPIAHGTVRGAMFLPYSYPHLFREAVSDPEHVKEYDAEVYEIEESLFNSLNSMEIGAGYQPIECEVAGHNVVVWFMSDSATRRGAWIPEYSKNTVPFAMA